ncbi:MAG: GGDEF domain-containing protein [Oscillospiraceae bacterium]|nr:GGDEF domain-containing protein [Oscillospiraceae bacterium]
MAKRKTICFITAVPEAIHAQRVASGIFAQCEKYGYNVAVFSSMITPDFYMKDYAAGELNIYDLPDFTRFDGVIIDDISLVLENKTELADSICSRIKEQTDAPLVAIGIPLRGVTMVESDNEVMFRELCRHAVNVHGCRDICILTGQKDNSEAMARLSVMLDELAKLNITVKDEHIVYGDFWYTSGKKLAEDMISGKISRPEVVIAASDHMALGLIEELTSHGIKVPEDIRVMGFEATQEALLNKISLTTMESNFAKAAADAVDKVRAIIEPSGEIIPFVPDLSNMMRLGRSCGCEPDIDRTMELIRASMHFFSKNYATDLYKGHIDIGLLMESYIPEKLTASQTPDECIGNLYYSIYILAPYENVYLCLREDWLDMDAKTDKGYPDKMKLVICRSKDGTDDLRSDSEAVTFNTSEMLPGMFDDHDAPYVYYFSPMHFGDNTLGYCVLQRALSEKEKINLVYRNWLRFANNALEMVRSKYQFVNMSYHDKMTGLLNRRGMYSEFEKLCNDATTDDKVFVSVIDMDGLKYINDTFGHLEGDFGINVVSKAAASMTGNHELCVRAGGDEFYVIGIGKYDDSIFEQKKELFYNTIAKFTENSKKSYTVTASIGFASRPYSRDIQLDSLIFEADEAMYHNKMLRKMKNNRP